MVEGSAGACLTLGHKGGRVAALGDWTVGFVQQVHLPGRGIQATGKIE